MKIEGYIEISFEEYQKLPVKEGISVNNLYEGKYFYFKKVQKFPIVFEDEWFRYEIEKDVIRITAKNTGNRFRFDYRDSFPLLVKAVEKAREVANK